jgi:hypothetical protein
VTAICVPLTGEEGPEADDGEAAAGGGDGRKVRGAGELGEGTAGCGGDRRSGRSHGAAQSGARRRGPWLRWSAEAVTGSGGKVACSGALDLDRTAEGGSGRGGACGEAEARIVLGPVTVRQQQSPVKHM